MEQEKPKSKNVYGPSFYLLFSIGVYLISLSQPIFSEASVKYEQEGYRGIIGLLVGWIPLLKGELAALSWLANPLLFASWIIFRCKWSAELLSYAATFFALLFLLFEEHYAIGYFLWLSSCILSSIGAFIRRQQGKTKKCSLIDYFTTFYKWGG